jgi:ribosomal protein S27AE
LITVGNYPDLASAQLAQSLLEAEGIPSSIPDQHLAGLDWRLTGGLGGVRLQVAPELAEAAIALLAQTPDFEDSELDQLAEDSAPPSDHDACPSCGSSSVASEASRRRAKALTMLFFPVLLLVWPFLAATTRRLQCSTCGHTWRPTSKP